MAGKTPLIAMLAVLSLAACTAIPENAAPPAPTVATTTPRIAPQSPPKPATTKPRAPARPAPTRAPQATAPTAPQPATAINANVTREPGGQSVLVTRGTATQPVPLFRQAIVLANVRAAVAGLPAQPKAEFQRGLLTLTFPPGSQSEVTTAINQALTVPEVTRLRANLPQ